MISAKKPSIWVEKSFYEIISFDMHSTAKLSPLPILKKNFFKKNHLFLKEDPNFGCFEKFHYFSPSLREIYNFMIKNFTIRIVISVIILPDTDIPTSSIGKLAFEPENFPILSAKNFTIRV